MSLCCIQDIRMIYALNIQSILRLNVFDFGILSFNSTADNLKRYVIVLK